MSAPASRIASSTLGLYWTILFGSIPQLAEMITLMMMRVMMMRVAEMMRMEGMITFGSACLILTASSFAAKPPKTTEWAAPSLTVASMAMTASVTMGM